MSADSAEARAFSNKKPPTHGAVFLCASCKITLAQSLWLASDFHPLAALIKFFAGQVQFVIPADAVAARVNFHLLKKPLHAIQCLERIPSSEQRRDIIQPPLPVRKED